MNSYFVLAALVCSVMLSGLYSTLVSAASLKIAPLEYSTVLAENESKKGFIDISNPTGRAMTVVSSVQAFRQTDDNGSLTFFDDEIIEKGVKLDLDEFILNPRESLRMYFIVDGSVLPSGNVFAAIFFTSNPTIANVGVGQAVRLGTILSVQNGTPSEQKSQLTQFSVPFIQWGNALSASYTVKNIGDPRKTTGFYPTISVSLEPLPRNTTVKSPLVFAGRSRSEDIKLPHNRFGVYKVTAATNGSPPISQWVLLLSPVWTASTGGILLLLGLIVFRVSRLRRRKITMPSRIERPASKRRK